MPLVLVVGSGFGGLECARRLETLRIGATARLVLVSPLDHLLYTPLLPEVATGVIEPRHLAVGLHRVLKRWTIVLGEVTRIDAGRRAAHVRAADGSLSTIVWDRLVIAPGSSSARPPVPGLDSFGMGFKTLAEAVKLRDHVLEQLSLADSAFDDRLAHCTFVIVGGGYTGTELAGQLASLTRRLLARYRNVKISDIRIVLVEMQERLMPELDVKLSRAALELLRRRGVEVRLSTAVDEIREKGVLLSTGELLPTSTPIWCAGTAPIGLATQVGLPTTDQRIMVGPDLQVPGYDGIFAFGDAAAVPDLTRPGQYCAQTAQHAVRQGALAAINVAASLGSGRMRSYRHRDLGFVVDLGGWYAVANPFGIPLSGLLAKAVTKGYHLFALPSFSNRLRVATDWLLNLITPNQMVQLDFVRSRTGLSGEDAKERRLTT